MQSRRVRVAARPRRRKVNATPPSRLPDHGLVCGQKRLATRRRHHHQVTRRRFYQMLCPGYGSAGLLDFVNVVQHTTRNADDQHFKIAPRLMLDAARYINNNALTQLDLAGVKPHPPLSTEDIVNLVGALVVMQFGVRDFEVVHLRGRAVLFFNQGTDLPTGFGPRKSHQPCLARYSWVFDSYFDCLSEVD